MQRQVWKFEQWLTKQPQLFSVSSVTTPVTNNTQLGTQTPVFNTTTSRHFFVALFELV